MGRPAILRVDIVGDAKGLNAGVDQANGKLGRLGGFAGKAGKAVGAGLALGAVAAVGFAAKAVGAASDVQQAYGALDSVYGRNSAQVKKWANSAASDVGLAKAEYANLSALIGAQLTNMGRSTEQAANQSRSLVKLGADLAATYGGSTREAVEALSSTLKGETDPIERYGVSIKQSDINARLAAQGLTGLTGKAAKQAQATAVLGLVTEQTGKAHGQFAREADSLAGSQQILTAKWENAKATLGQKLLPVVAGVTSWFADKFLPAAQRLAGQLAQQLGPTIASVGRFITDRLVPAARQIYGWFVDKIVPAIRDYVRPVLAGIRSAFASVSSSIDDNSGNLSKLAHFLGVVVPPTARILGKVLGGVLGVEFRIIGAVIGGVIGTIARLVGWIDTAVGKIRALAGAVKSAGGFLGKVGGLFGSSPVDGMVAGPLAYGQPGLAQPYAGGMATASAGGPLAFLAGGTRPAGGAAVVYVDRRSFSATVEGEVVDRHGAALAIRQLLDEFAVRTGAAPSWAG